MFKRLFSIFLLGLLALWITGCGIVEISGGGGNIVRGSGRIVSENRPVSNFTSVAFTGAGEGTITVGDSESLTIEADDNILPLLDSTVVGGKLTLGVKPGSSYSTNRAVRYTVTVKSLSGVETSGSVNVTVKNTASAESFTATTSGSGNLKIDSLQVKSLTLRTSGSGNIQVAGTADQLNATTSGSGNIQADGLACGSATVTTSGSGTVTVWVKDALNARTSGSGNIKYYGQPNVTRSESGSGRVSGLGSK